MQTSTNVRIKEWYVDDDDDDIILNVLNSSDSDTDCTSESTDNSDSEIGNDPDITDIFQVTRSGRVCTTWKWRLQYQ